MSMSFGGSDTSSNSKTTVDPWSKQQYTNIAGQVQNTLGGNYGGSYTPYTGQMTAGLTPAQQQAEQMAQTNIGAGQGLLGSASQGATSGLNFNPAQVNPQSLASTNLTAYENPYTSDVINTTMAQLDQQRQRDINGQAGQFTQAGAWGGSREGAADALTNQAYGQIAANTIAGLNSQNFSQAQAAAQNDIYNNLAAQQANQNAGLAGAGLNLESSGLLGTLAGQQQQMGQNDASFLNGFGQQDQTTQQNYLSNLYNEFLRGQINPAQQAQYQLGLLGVTPMTTDTKGNAATVSGSAGFSIPFVGGK